MSTKTNQILSAILLCIAALSATPAFAQRESPQEQALWKLEHAYWQDVKANDLEHYRNLWHPDFVGWPMSSPAPLRKAHITDWITAFTTKGLSLKSFTLKPAASHATGNIVVTYYWMTTLWVDRQGRGQSTTFRVTHTWIKTAVGWHILGGMSAPESSPPASH